jgi:gluconokinase
MVVKHRDDGRNSQQGRRTGYDETPFEAACRGNGRGCVRERVMGRQDETVSAQAIIIMGVSGSGKSTLAGLLGRQLDCPFFEGDSFHSEANVAKMRGGEPLTDADRWPWLDLLGETIGRAVRQEGVAVAACSALKLSYRERLRTAIGAPTGFALLEVGREELVRRLNDRPGHYMPASLIDSQLAILEKPSPDERAITIDSMLPPEAEADRVLQWLAAGNAKRPARAG